MTTKPDEYRLVLYFKGRAEPVVYRFQWPGADGAPSPGEVESSLLTFGSLTTVSGARISWDTDAVELAEVSPFPPPRDSPKKIPPEPKRRRSI